VLTVWQPCASLTAAEALAALSGAEAQRLAAEGTALARKVGFDAQALVRRGDPAWRRIVRSANELGASIVVLGSHGRTGVRDLLMGSVAAGTARYAECDVLIVHGPPQARAA
jgi:nucleotide-binding universal stress UspA family protein